jgi:Mg-chelatase subunit ChlD
MKFAEDEPWSLNTPAPDIRYGMPGVLASGKLLASEDFLTAANSNHWMVSMDYLSVLWRALAAAFISLTGHGAAVVTLLLACGFLPHGAVRAGEFQLLSVKEQPPGTVVATAAILTGSTPRAGDFRLKVNGHAVGGSDIKPASAVVLDTSIILEIDQSGSMGTGRIRQIQEALRTVLGKPDSNLNLALWAFDTEVRKIHGFSRDPAQLSKSIAEISAKYGRDSKTKLFEAIELGLSELRSRDGKDLKRLIVITDGKDDGSSISEDVAASNANAQNIAIDVIGFGDVAAPDAELLGRLTKNTGGHFISARSAQELAGELHKLFNIAPPRVFDVTFRYEPSTDGRQADSAQVELSPSGKAPATQAITQRLSAFHTGDAAKPASSDKNREGNFDVGTLLGILIGIIVAIVLFMMVKKRPAPSAAPPPPPAPPPVRPAPAGRARTSVGFAFPAPAPGQPAALLYCTGGPAKGRKYPVEQRTFHIGSGEANELQLSDEYVSNRHAVIKYDEGNLYLSDSESRNGTWLNDARLGQTARVLSPGDRIRTGKSIFELVPPGEQPVGEPYQNQKDEGESLVP